MTSRSLIRIATRGSQQARTQSEAVAAQLRAALPGVHVELLIIETMGDRTQAAEVPLHQIGGQGVFVKEVQRAVLDGKADIAVHSAKDLTSSVSDGLVIGAVTSRRDPRDALIGATLAGLAEGATVATGSVRRRAQLAGMRPDLRFVELRGNIGRRLDKIPAGGAIVMAVAALEVLGMTDRVTEAFDVEAMVPQVGQGAVAVECRTDDSVTQAALAAIEHGVSRAAVDVERAFLAEIGAGCSLPVGAHVVAAGPVLPRRLLTYFADDTGEHRSVVVLDGDAQVDVDLARQAARELLSTAAR